MIVRAMSRLFALEARGLQLVLQLGVTNDEDSKGG
jgi:hypothetical protein